MAAEKKSRQDRPDDFIRIQDLFYLCLAKWYWFVISLVITLGIATVYLLKTPPVYTRSAMILIKDDQSRKIHAQRYWILRFGAFTEQYQC